MRSKLTYLILLPIILLQLGCKDEFIKHDLYRIWNNRLYGYINSDGTTEIGLQFAYALPFSEGLAAVNVGGTPNGADMPTDGRWGFINTTGGFVLNPIYHSPENDAPPFARNDVGKVLHEAYIFKNHVAAVRMDNGWQYIDTLGNTLRKDFVPQSCRTFHEGLAATMVDGYWGYVRKLKSSRSDKDSAIVMHIPPNFLYPVDFRDGFAVVKDRKGRKICIDHNGREVFSQYRIENQFHEGMVAVRANFKGEPTNELDYRKFSIMDTLGRVWFPHQFDEIGYYSSGLIPVRVGSQKRSNDHTQYSDYDGGKWGFVNKDGTFIINPQYDYAMSFQEDRAAIKKGNFWGYIDQNNSWIAHPQFLWAGEFQQGIAKVLLGPSANDFFNHYAYLDRAGNVIWVEP